MPNAQLESRSPPRPDDLVVALAEAEPKDVHAAFERARAAQRGWAALAAPARANALATAAERFAAAAPELTELGIREVGKPRSEMAGEVARAVAILRYYAPQALAMALRTEELLRECLPDGLFGVVAGDARTGEALIEAADAISFTGSVAVGEKVIARAAARNVPVQAEMGGQNPSIVLPDADLERAAAAVATAAMSFSGQKCTATSRVIVVGDPAPFTEALAAAVERLAIGDPADASTVIGPVIEADARAAVIDAAAAASAAGARIVTGGSAPERDGYYVLPTLVDRITPEMLLAREEVFGPIAAILAASDVDEAIAVANSVRYGLAAAVFTSDLDSAMAVSSRLEAGLVKVNAPTSGVDYYAPFGGTKASSYGPREQGKAARDFYTWSQTVTIAPARG